MTPHASSRAWAGLIAAEVLSAAVGFFVLLHFARTLGTRAFSSVEYATAIAALMLVWVRGGVETIAHREAARKPRLIAPISEALLIAKLALAVLAFSLILVYGRTLNYSTLPALLAAASILFPAALCLDVAPRSRCEFGWIAALQVVRTLGLLGAAFILVSDSSDATLATGCLSIAEAVAAIAFGWLHVRRFGFPRLNVRRRTVRVLLARGCVTSLGRFARVFLYSADLIILGAILGATELGPFAAARRIVFAILAVGLIVPSMLGPWMAKAWVYSPHAASRQVVRITSNLLGPTLAASLGLMLTARGWMATLFGRDYESGGVILALFATRLPLMMLVAIVTSALVAIRRENSSLSLLAIACLLTPVTVPAAALLSGPAAAAVVMLGIESFVLVSGWLALTRAGAVSTLPSINVCDLAGIVGMLSLIFLARDQPNWAISLFGGIAYGAIRVCAKRLENRGTLAAPEIAR